MVSNADGEAYMRQLAGLIPVHVTYRLHHRVHTAEQSHSANGKSVSRNDSLSTGLDKLSVSADHSQ